MKLSKERQTFVALLGLGLTALAIDRVLMAPAGAQAAAVTLETLEKASMAEVPVSTPGGPSKPRQASGPSLSNRLVSMSELRKVRMEAVRDAFVPGAGWGMTLVAEPEPEDRAPGSADFAEKYHPQLIFRAAGRAIVKVGSRQCRIGDTIDGWTLLAIGRGSIVFGSGCKILEFPISDSAAATRPTDNGRTNKH